MINAIVYSRIKLEDFQPHLAMTYHDVFRLLLFVYSFVVFIPANRFDLLRTKACLITKVFKCNSYNPLRTHSLPDRRHRKLVDSFCMNSVDSTLFVTVAFPDINFFVLLLYTTTISFK